MIVSPDVRPTRAWGMCARADGAPKRRYAHRRDARRAAQSMRVQGCRVDVYECVGCGGWHLGSPIRRDHRGG